MSMLASYPNLRLIHLIVAEEICPEAPHFPSAADDLTLAHTRLVLVEYAQQLIRDQIAR